MKVRTPAHESARHPLAGRIEVAEGGITGERGRDKAGDLSIDLRRYTVRLDGADIGEVRQVQRDAQRADRFGNRHRSGRGAVTLWLFDDGQSEYTDYTHRTLGTCLFESVSAMLGLPV